MSGAICGEALKEIIRKPNGIERWCFTCRATRPFEYVVLAPVSIESWYGPTPAIECAVCHTTDSDMFPGTYREWEDA